MIWFFAEDHKHYTDLKPLKEKYSLSDILVMPDLTDIKASITKASTAVIAPYLPPKDLKSFFVLVELPNEKGILTSQEIKANVSEAVALEKRLGLSVIESPFTLEDLAGAQPLKDWTEMLLIAEEQGYRAKAVLLVGIPGTGKTFFPKCFAGHTKRLLIMLNLSIIMETTEPIFTLNRVFEYLSYRNRLNPNEKYVILIDEIEKMIGNSSPQEKRILGRLLTVLNDIHTPASEYNFNAIFFVTANDLNNIIDNNPELLRRGRFDELFFINLPKDEMATQTFQIYMKKFGLEIIASTHPIKKIMMNCESYYGKERKVANHFVYTAGEIESFCKQLYFLKLAKGGAIKESDITDTIQKVIPIWKTSQEGISKMLGQKELFSECK